MAFKKTRMACSVACGILSLLWLGLWIQGQSTCTIVTGKVSSSCVIQIGCLPGSLFFDLMTSNGPTNSEEVEKVKQMKRWDVESYIVDEVLLAAPGQKEEYSKVWGSFSLRGEPKTIPFWFLTLFTATAAAVSFPWRHVGWRFSLRTLLITMTAVAVGLWFIIWMARR